jgi:hypothetical protein
MWVKFWTCHVNAEMQLSLQAFGLICESCDLNVTNEVGESKDLETLNVNNRYAKHKFFLNFQCRVFCMSIVCK